MKAVVVYDTYYGNTKQVAEAIVEQVRSEGYEAELRSVREDYPTPPQGDFAFVGSPIRMYAVTRKTRKFLKKLDKSQWKDKPIASFVTIGKPKENPTEKEKANFQKISIAPGIEFREMIKEMGLTAYNQVLYVEVKDGWKGPLVDDGIEKTKKFVHEFLMTLKK
jgi:flavodoxin